MVEGQRCLRRGRLIITASSCVYAFIYLFSLIHILCTMNFPYVPLHFPYIDNSVCDGVKCVFFAGALLYLTLYFT